jgi:hypothetical protein
MPLKKQYFGYNMVVRFIGGGNQCTEKFTHLILIINTIHAFLKRTMWPPLFRVLVTVVISQYITQSA